MPAMAPAPLQWIFLLGVAFLPRGALAARVAFEARTSSTATALRFASKMQGAAVADFPARCAPEIAAETCRLLDEENPEAMSRGEIAEALSSTGAAVEGLWSKLGLAGDEEVACEALCHKLVSFLESQDWVLPGGSDLGCYVDEEGSDRCDLDLSKAELDHAGHFDDDLPDFHASERVGETVAAGNESDDADTDTAPIEYKLGQLAMHLANMFRIFPKVPVEMTGLDDEKEEAGAALLQGNRTGGYTYSWAWRSDIMKVNQLAQAVVSDAIRNFNSFTTRPHLQKWFGSLAYSTRSSRERVRQVLNSVDHMLGDVDYVFPGPQCSPYTYAYVYPGYKYPMMSRRPYICKPNEIRFNTCTKTTEDKFVFYLCELTIKSSVKEQIETLTHEGSHHATAYTTDICLEDDWTGLCTSRKRAYGRPTCRMLARKSMEKAVNNADNYCYFLSDMHNSSS